MIAGNVEIKVARNGKRCKCCGERIPAGRRYVLVDMWTWLCLSCHRKAWGGAA